MSKLFEIVILDEAFEFLNGLEKKHYEKIIYNIRKSQVRTDPELFKKLTDEIWEFRTLYQGIQYRLLAFWDKTLSTETLVISTHLLRKEVKFQKMKFKKQQIFEPGIFQTNKKIRKNESIYTRRSSG
jgi:hypothetical protein